MRRRRGRPRTQRRFEVHSRLLEALWLAVDRQLTDAMATRNGLADRHASRAHRFARLLSQAGSHRHIGGLAYRLALCHIGGLAYRLALCHIGGLAYRLALLACLEVGGHGGAVELAVRGAGECRHHINLAG